MPGNFRELLLVTKTDEAFQELLQTTKTDEALELFYYPDYPNMLYMSAKLCGFDVREPIF